MKSRKLPQDELEEERARLMRELREALRARDEFLAIVSHDLRSPLTGVQLAIQALLHWARRATTGSLDPNRMISRLAAVDERVQDVLKLLERLLDFSQLSAGPLKLRVEPVDLAALVRKMGQDWKERFSAAGSALVVRSDEPVMGTWDPARLEQVVANLLSNALMHSGGKPVELSVQADADSAWINIVDQGSGIAPEDQTRIFRRFERIHRDGVKESFGLGLWIVQRLVDAMGGSVEVQSELGHGSTFTVRLPLSPPSE